MKYFSCFLVIVAICTLIYVFTPSAINGQFQISSDSNFRFSHGIHKLEKAVNDLLNTSMNKLKPFWSEEEIEPKNDSPVVVERSASFEHLLEYYIQDMSLMVERMREEDSLDDAIQDFEAFTVKSEQVIQIMQDDPNVFQDMLYKLSKLPDENLAAIVTLSLSQGQSSVLSGQAMVMLEEEPDKKLSNILYAFLNYSMLDHTETQDQLRYHLANVDSQPAAREIDVFGKKNQQQVRDQKVVVNPAKLAYAKSILDLYNAGANKKNTLLAGHKDDPFNQNNNNKQKQSEEEQVVRPKQGSVATLLMSQYQRALNKQATRPVSSAQTNLSTGPYSSTQGMALSTQTKNVDCAKINRSLFLLSKFSSKSIDQKEIQRLKGFGC